MIRWLAALARRRAAKQYDDVLTEFDDQEEHWGRCCLSCAGTGRLTLGPKDDRRTVVCAACGGQGR